MADLAPLPVLHDDQLKERAREFVEFLDHDDSGNRDAIKRMLRLGERRLVVSLDELRDYKRELADGCAGFLSFLRCEKLMQMRLMQVAQDTAGIPACFRCSAERSRSVCR